MASLVANLQTLLDPAFWRQQYGNWRARRFDRRHGLETGLAVPVKDIHDATEEQRRHAVLYQATALPKFERAMAALAIDHRRFTFVDYGSGKGRVVLLAARFPFHRVIGVEMSSALNEVAAANMAAFGRTGIRAASIELKVGDAREFPVPAGDIVAYFYNPFDEIVLGDVWAKLRDALRREPRDLAIVYVNPVHRVVFDRSELLQANYDDGAVVVYRTAGPARIGPPTGSVSKD